MPRGYWIVRVDVSDPDSYGAYVAANAKAFSKYGAKFLVRSGKFESMEGTARSRNVVLEFADYEAALACYNSPEYAEAMALRMNAASSDLIVIEGYDVPERG